MNSYKVEYLSVINSKEDFCKSISSFNNFLQSYDNIKITAGKIKFDGITFSYGVQFGDIIEDAQRYFHVTFNCDDLKDSDKFKAMLRAIRTLLTKASGKPPEILWDDFSSELAERAYPIVHELENLMRKLITKFMFIKIGVAWIKDAVPKEVSESVKSKKEVAGHNFLYEVDFIQLSNFLFKEYSTANSRQLVEKLSKANKIEELELLELQELVPRSNWERYFSPIVSCKIEYLQSRWQRLYILRCLVAHNNFVSDSQFDEICALSGEVKDKLIQALDGLDNVQVSNDQKEDVVENIASEINSEYGEFIYNWNVAVQLLKHLVAVTDVEMYVGDVKASVKRSPAVYVRALTQQGVFDKGQFNKFAELMDFRNSIINNASFNRDSVEVKSYNLALREFQITLSDLIGKHTSI